MLSPIEAEEYCAYKRQKRVEEVRRAFLKAELETIPLTLESLKKTCATALKLHVAAVRVTSEHVRAAKSLLGESVGVDVAVGGDGSQATKVKAYETKYALRLGGREISLVLSEAMRKSDKTGEMKKEIAKIVKSAKRGLVKIALREETAISEIARIAKLVGESGGKFVSVPYFSGVEELRAAMGDCCMLEVREVSDAAQFKALVRAGVERISTARAEEIFAELMREAENCTFPDAYEPFFASGRSSVYEKSLYASAALSAPEKTVRKESESQREEQSQSS